MPPNLECTDKAMRTRLRLRVTFPRCGTTPQCGERWTLEHNLAISCRCVSQHLFESIRGPTRNTNPLMLRNAGIINVKIVREKKYLQTSSISASVRYESEILGIDSRAFIQCHSGSGYSVTLTSSTCAVHVTYLLYF